MNEETKVVNIEEKKEEAKVETPKEEKEGVITLSRPYKFEGKEYTEVDLSGIKNLKIKDAIEAQKQLFNEREIAATIMSETTTAFARAIAAKATGKPIEFFKFAPHRLSKRVNQVVQSNMNATTQIENHVMKFEKPYVFEGKEYKEIDLSGIADITSMNESEAENKLVRAGFTITETSALYLYSCIIASMVTGLPEDFFTNLPFTEVLKLRVAVNDPDFFE